MIVALVEEFWVDLCSERCEIRFHNTTISTGAGRKTPSPDGFKAFKPLLLGYFYIKGVELLIS